VDDPSACEQGAPLGHRITGLGDEHRVLATGGVDDDLGEAEDRLLAPERGHDPGRRIDLDAEPPPEPARDRLAELRQPLRLRVAPRVGKSVDERLTDQRVGRLPRVALAEVEDLDA